MTERAGRCRRVRSSGDPLPDRRRTHQPRIADRLFSGNATVKTHINRIFAKINVTDRGGATAYARRLNLTNG